jgi:hypothetical protein
MVMGHCDLLELSKDDISGPLANRERVVSFHYDLA